jgi:hypothetical protein
MRKFETETSAYKKNTYVRQSFVSTAENHFNGEQIEDVLWCFCALFKFIIKHNYESQVQGFRLTQHWFG